MQQLEKDLTTTILDYKKKATNIKYSLLLLDSDNLREFQSLIKCVTEGTQLSLMDSVMSEFCKLCIDIHHITYQVVFGPISKQLDIVTDTETWAQFDTSLLHNSNLPDYSFSPQEYITQVLF